MTTPTKCSSSPPQCPFLVAHKVQGGSEAAASVSVNFAIPTTRLDDVVGCLGKVRQRVWRTSPKQLTNISSKPCSRHFEVDGGGMSKSSRHRLGSWVCQGFWCCNTILSLCRIQFKASGEGNLGGFETLRVGSSSVYVQGPTSGLRPLVRALCRIQFKASGVGISVVFQTLGSRILCAHHQETLSAACSEKSCLPALPP